MRWFSCIQCVCCPDLLPQPRDRAPSGSRVPRRWRWSRPRPFSKPPQTINRLVPAANSSSYSFSEYLLLPVLSTSHTNTMDRSLDEIIAEDTVSFQLNSAPNDDNQQLTRFIYPASDDSSFGWPTKPRSRPRPPSWWTRWCQKGSYQPVQFQWIWTVIAVAWLQNFTR